MNYNAYINPRDAGLYANSGLDISDQLNNYLAICAGNKKNAYLEPQGLYLKTKSIFHPSNLTVELNGATVKSMNGTTGSDMGWLATDPTLLIPSNNVYLNNGTIDGNAANRTGTGQAALFYCYQNQNYGGRDLTLINGVSDGLYTGGEYFTTSTCNGIAGTSSSTTITLTGASTTPAVGNWIVQTDGPGEGQKAQITAYNSGTAVATVSPAWATVPVSGVTRWSVGTSNDRTSVAKHGRFSNITCLNNYRNNDSIVGCRDLVIEYSTFNGAVGASPKCGVDFEPNTASGPNTDVTVFTCTANGNGLDGYTEAMPYNYRCKVDNCSGSSNVRFGGMSNSDFSGLQFINFKGAGNGTALLSGDHNVDLLNPSGVVKQMPLWNDAVGWTAPAVGSWGDVMSFSINCPYVGDYIVMEAVVAGTTTAAQQIFLRFVDVDNSVNGTNLTKVVSVNYFESIKERFTAGATAGTRNFKIQAQNANTGAMTIGNIKGSIKVMRNVG